MPPPPRRRINDQMETKGMAFGDNQKIYGNLEEQTTYSYISQEDIVGSDGVDKDSKTTAIYGRYLVSYKTAKLLTFMIVTWLVFEAVKLLPSIVVTCLVIRQ